MSAHIADNLRALMSEHGVGTNELARRVGVSPGYISQIRHRNRPCSETVARQIAKALGVSLWRLTDSRAENARSDLADLIEANPSAARHIHRVYAACLDAIHAGTDPEVVVQAACRAHTRNEEDQRRTA